jgi:hypothetical protein
MLESIVIARDQFWLHKTPQQELCRPKPAAKKPAAKSRQNPVSAGAI